MWKQLPAVTAGEQTAGNIPAVLMLRTGDSNRVELIRLAAGVQHQQSRPRVSAAGAEVGQAEEQSVWAELELHRRLAGEQDQCVIQAARC